MNTNEMIELTDLEPENEVVGGAGFEYAVLTLGGQSSLNLGMERTGGLIYSGESGGMNE
jgi:hypothetical protein